MICLPDNKYNGEALMSQPRQLRAQVHGHDGRLQLRANNGPNDFSNPINNTDDTNDMANDLNCLKANGTCGNLYFGSGNYEKPAGNNTPIVVTSAQSTTAAACIATSGWDNARSQAGVSANSTTPFDLVAGRRPKQRKPRYFRPGFVRLARGRQLELTILDHESYYVNNATAPGSNRVKMGSVVPAYYPYYQQGGWGSDAAAFTILHINGSYVDNLSNIVLPSNENYVQMVTWNDLAKARSSSRR